MSCRGFPGKFLLESLLQNKRWAHFFLCPLETSPPVLLKFLYLTEVLDRQGPICQDTIICFISKCVVTCSACENLLALFLVVP